MHELSLAQSLVEQLEEVVAADGAGRVVSVSVEIGALSGVERDAFEFAFPIAAEGTVLAAARLDVIEVPVTIVCRACGAQSHPEPPVLLCEQCQGVDYDLIGGRDFLIKSLEVDDDVH